MTVSEGGGDQCDQHPGADHAHQDPLGGVAAVELVGCEREGGGEDGAQVAVDDLDRAQQPEHGGGAGAQPVRGCPPVAVGVAAAPQRAPYREVEQPGPHRNSETVRRGLGQLPLLAGVGAGAGGVARIGSLHRQPALVAAEGPVGRLEVVLAYGILGHDVVAGLPQGVSRLLHLGRMASPYNPEKGHGRSLEAVCRVLCAFVRPYGR